MSTEKLKPDCPKARIAETLEPVMKVEFLKRLKEIKGVLPDRSRTPSQYRNKARIIIPRIINNSVAEYPPKLITWPKIIIEDLPITHPKLITLINPKPKK